MQPLAEARRQLKHAAVGHQHHHVARHTTVWGRTLMAIPLAGRGGARPPPFRAFLSRGVLPDRNPGGNIGGNFRHEVGCFLRIMGN